MTESQPQRRGDRRLGVGIALAAALALRGCTRGTADDNPARAWLASVADPGYTAGGAVTNRQTPPMLYRALAS